MNNMRNLVIEKLKNAGYDAIPVNVSKNGNERTGITVMFPNSTECEKCGRTFYLDYYAAYHKDEYTEEDVTEIADDIIRIYESEKDGCRISVETVMQHLNSKEFVLENSYIAIQKITDEDIVKIPVLDLEAYVRIDCSNALDIAPEIPTIKVSENMLKSLKIDEKELFVRAIENTKERICISSMIDVLKDFEVPDDMLADMNIGMTIISNKEGAYGSGVLLYPEIFRDFCIQNNLAGVYIIPSSIHECIIQPMAVGDFEPAEDELKNMIKTVNETTVSEEEFLSDSLYAYSIERDGIYIV